MELLLTMLHYMILGFSLAAPIGPMNMEVVKRGLTEGIRASWLVGLGGLSGDMILLVAIFFGFHQLLQNQLIQLLMYAFGVGMLIYLGVSSIQTALYKNIGPIDNERHGKNSFFTGITISIANPISLVFWFGVYGTSLQIIRSNFSLTVALICSFAIILGLFLWNLQLVLIVHYSKKMLNEQILRGITFCAGILLLGFGGQFFFELMKFLD